MKIIIGVLIAVILGMGLMIIMGSNGNSNDSKATLNNNREVSNNDMNNLDEEKLREHCKSMPNMEGCEKFKNENDSPVLSGKIEILKNDIQLGEIPMDEGKVEIVYEIKNIGDADVILGDADGSCFCTQGFVTNEDGSNKSSEINTIGTNWPLDLKRVIKPGEKQIVTAIYDPLAHGPNVLGPTTRGLTLKTNSKETPVLRLNFSGTVVKTRSE